MTRGWRGESKRHSLAAKGLKSGRKHTNSTGMYATPFGKAFDEADKGGAQISKEIAKYVDFSRTPVKVLRTILSDATANPFVREKARRELKKREKKK